MLTVETRHAIEIEQVFDVVRHNREGPRHSGSGSQRQDEGGKEHAVHFQQTGQLRRAKAIRRWSRQWVAKARHEKLATPLRRRDPHLTSRARVQHLHAE